jgi:hypothetical protein
LLVLLPAAVVNMVRLDLVDGGDARLLYVHLTLQELGQLVTASTRGFRVVSTDVDGGRDGDVHVALAPLMSPPPAWREESVADRVDPQRPVGATSALSAAPR